MRKWIVDRIEEEYAVCYDGGEKADIPLSLLPEGIRTGVTVQQDGMLFTIDAADTAARHARIHAKFARLRRKE